MDKKYLSILPEVEAAIAENRPIVALESAILSHGMPYPRNIEFSQKIADIIRSEGAVPAICAIMGGYLKIGLSPEELEKVCKAEKIDRVSRREVAIYLAAGKTGSATMATTVMAAEMAGIHILATGDLGSVHRETEVSVSISPDLLELSHSSVAVICTGTKPLQDVELTLEYLAHMGVPVMGLGTDNFPAVNSRKNSFRVDFNAVDHETAAWILHTKWRLGMEGGAIVANPMPAKYEPDSDDMEAVIKQALAETKKNGGRGRSRSIRYPLTVNPEVMYNNARHAAKVAAEYVKAEEQCIS